MSSDAWSRSITAFPVLARILTELNLVNDKVGVIVLSAGVGNDVGTIKFVIKQMRADTAANVGCGMGPTRPDDSISQRGKFNLAYTLRL